MAARSAFVASARVRDLLVHAKRVFVVAKAQAGITTRPTSGSSTGSSAGSSRSTKQRTATIINRFNIFSILRAVKNGSVSREGGSQRGNCATAAVTALVASARVWSCWFTPNICSSSPTVPPYQARMWGISPLAVWRSFLPAVRFCGAGRLSSEVTPP